MDQQNIPPQPQGPIISQQQSKLSPFLMLGGTVIVLLVGIGGYFVGKSSNKAIISPTPTVSQKKACTADAKMCPDGSYVGRTGPNCEFAPCPTGTNPKEILLSPTGEIISDLCLNYLGQPQSEEICKNIPAEGRSCKTNNDCLPTCAHGCLNSNWKSPTPLADCMAEPTYTCKCTDNICRKAN